MRESANIHVFSKKRIEGGKTKGEEEMTGGVMRRRGSGRKERKRGGGMSQGDEHWK